MHRCGERLSLCNDKGWKLLEKRCGLSGQIRTADTLNYKPCFCNPSIPHISCAIILTTKHALFTPPCSDTPTIVLGQDQQCLLASLVMCVLGDFRIISCKGGWLLDSVSLICIHSHEGSHRKSSQQCTVRSTVFVFAASPLKMGSSTLPILPFMVMRLRDVLLRQSSKLPIASSPTYMGR